MYIKVHAVPDSRDESVAGKGADTLIIRVKEPAEGNCANKRILGIVRQRYPGRAVRMVSGHQSSHKIISVV